MVYVSIQFLRSSTAFYYLVLIKISAAASLSISNEMYIFRNILRFSCCPWNIHHTDRKKKKYTQPAAVKHLLVIISLINMSFIADIKNGGAKNVIHVVFRNLDELIFTRILQPPEYWKRGSTYAQLLKCQVWNVLQNSFAARRFIIHFPIIYWGRKNKN